MKSDLYQQAIRAGDREVRQPGVAMGLFAEACRRR